MRIRQAFRHSSPGIPVRPRAALPLLLVLAGTLGGCMLPRWPAQGELVSPFGLRLRGLRPDLHRGVDLDLPEGTEVRTMARGTVRFAGEMRGYGEVIWIDHPGQVITVYAHLSSIGVRPGDRVGGGEVIGLSGRSGDATGPHLHFEVWRRGREVDPVPFLGGFPPARR